MAPSAVYVLLPPNPSVPEYCLRRSDRLRAISCRRDDPAKPVKNDRISGADESSDFSQFSGSSSYQKADWPIFFLIGVLDISLLGEKTVRATARYRRWVAGAGALILLAAVPLVGVMLGARDAQAGLFSHKGSHNGCDCENGPPTDDIGGTWYWLRSPDEEKRVVMGLFNRYCIRCHGVDGRGVWDIPGVPDFTNTRWQASRSDGQIARIILEGRGAVMPPFRGAISLEEAWGLARYLRTFVPGTEVSKPDLGKGGTPAKP